MLSSSNYYEIGKSKGDLVSQGLMAAGNLASDIITKKQEKSEKDKADKITKAMTSYNVITKSIEDLPAETQQQIITGQLIPMLSNAGVFGEGTSKEDIANIVAQISTASKEQKERSRIVFRQAIDDINSGDPQKAEAAMAAFDLENGDPKAMKDYIKNSISEYKEKSAKKAEKIEKEEANKAENTKEIQIGILSGKYKDLSNIAPEEQAAYKGPMVKNYAGTGLTVGAQSEEEKFQTELDQEKKIAQAKGDIEVETAKKKAVAEIEVARQQGGVTKLTEAEKEEIGFLYDELAANNEILRNYDLQRGQIKRDIAGAETVTHEAASAVKKKNMEIQARLDAYKTGSAHTGTGLSAGQTNLNARGGNVVRGKILPEGQTSKALDETTAAQILKEANGDPEKARQIARSRGYTI